MSTYNDMWNTIKSEVTTLELADAWIRVTSPARGLEINFMGVRVLDVDLLEALRNWRTALEHDLAIKQVSIKQAYILEVEHVSRALQLFADAGLIVDHRQPNFD